MTITGAATELRCKDVFSRMGVELKEEPAECPAMKRLNSSANDASRSSKLSRTSGGSCSAEPVPSFVTPRKAKALSVEAGSSPVSGASDAEVKEEPGATEPPVEAGASDAGPLEQVAARDPYSACRAPGPGPIADDDEDGFVERLQALVKEETPTSLLAEVVAAELAFVPPVPT